MIGPLTDYAALLCQTGLTEADWKKGSFAKERWRRYLVGVRLFARRTFTTPKIRTFTTPKFGHFPPPKKNICQEDNCHPQFFFSFFGAFFLAFSTYSSWRTSRMGRRRCLMRWPWNQMPRNSAILIGKSADLWLSPMNKYFSILLPWFTAQSKLIKTLNCTIHRYSFWNVLHC